MRVCVPVSVKPDHTIWDKATGYAVGATVVPLVQAVSDIDRVNAGQMPAITWPDDAVGKSLAEIVITADNVLGMLNHAHFYGAKVEWPTPEPDPLMQWVEVGYVAGDEVLVGVDMAKGSDRAVILKGLNSEPALWTGLDDGAYFEAITVKFQPGERIDTLSSYNTGKGGVSPRGLITPSAESERIVQWPIDIQWQGPEPTSTVKPPLAGLNRTATDGERLGRMAWVPGSNVETP